jgi:hypothetical protein
MSLALIESLESMVKVLRRVSLEKRKAALPEMGSNGKKMVASSSRTERLARGGPACQRYKVSVKC